MNALVTLPHSSLHGSIHLEGSKSISNRLLIMQALGKQSFPIHHLSPSDDTQTLLSLLQSGNMHCDVGAAGTTMRFLTAYFAHIPGTRILTGSDRMKNRPIHILVDALRSLGAEIKYLDKEGYPPLQITGKSFTGSTVNIQAHVSSQYISALMLIAPALEQGLTIQLEGKISSLPYILMTLRLMQSLGIQCSLAGNMIHIQPGKYSAKEVHVEGDWSAASYYFSMAAIAPQSEIYIRGVRKNSLQGDAVLPDIYKELGVETVFNEEGCILKHNGNVCSFFHYDFSDCPDLAQTVVVTCAALGIPGAFTGLESLKIKETDRTEALAAELKKFNVRFYPEGDAWQLTGKVNNVPGVEISTYEDHRMAMCFTPLAVLQPIIIREKHVVNKSYPSFWDDIESLGFTVASVG